MISYPSPCLIGLDVMPDIEMFKPYCEDSDSRTHTVLDCFEQFLPNKGCKEVLIRCLSTPTCDVEELTKRQQHIRDYYNVPDETLKELAEYEDDMLWVLHQKGISEEIVDSLDYVYIKWSWLQKTGFNTSHTCLGIKNTYTVIFAPLFGILSPLLSILIPYFVLVFKFKVKIPFVNFAKFVSTLLFKAVMLNLQSQSLCSFQTLTYVVYILMYFHTLYNTFDTSRNTYKVIHFVNTKVKGFLRYLHATTGLLHSNYSLPFDLSNNNNVLKNIVLFKEIQTNKNNIKTRIQEYLSHINEILMFVSVASFLKDMKACFVDYIDDISTVTISMEESYHICLPESVKNDIQFDSSHCLITGPNAAGKSTLIKSFVINVLLAQSLGIAMADSMKLTPLYFINTQINIPDSKGKLSLFEAEMYRCKHLFDILKELPTSKRCLFVMDEMFNSTNPLEGASSAYAVMKKLCSYENVCNVVTTHLIMLSKLKNFTKLKMERSDDESFTYKLKKGVSKQFLAVEMLKDHFDQDVVDEAIRVKNKLLV